MAHNPPPPAGVLLIDLDGTLVGPDGVNPRVWAPLAALRDQGWRLSVCTGRPGQGLALAIAQRLDPEGLHVFNSGASVVGGDGAYVDGSPMSGLPLTAAIDFALADAAIDLEAYTATGHYLTTERTVDIARHEALLDVPAQVVSFPPDPALGAIVRIQWLISEPHWDKVKPAATRLRDLDFHFGRSPLMPDVCFISVLAGGVSKATGAAQVLAHYGLGWHQTAAVGDSGNDGPLLERVHRAFAVANAIPEIKGLAARQVASARDGGVADVAALLCP